DARPLRIGKAADDEFLRRLALHLQPVGRTAMFVRRIATLRDDPFPSFAARAFPGLVVFERLDTADRRVERQSPEDRAPFVERKAGQIAAVEPDDVEDVIGE